MNEVKDQNENGDHRESMWSTYLSLHCYGIVEPNMHMFGITGLSRGIIFSRKIKGKYMCFGRP